MEEFYVQKLSRTIICSRGYCWAMTYGVNNVTYICYIYMYVFMYIYKPIHTLVYIFILYMYIHIYVLIYMYTCIYVYVHMSQQPCLWGELSQFVGVSKWSRSSQIRPCPNSQFYMHYTPNWFYHIHVVHMGEREGVGAGVTGDWGGEWTVKEQWFGGAESLNAGPVQTSWVVAPWY